jgi:hypothetical protein
MGIPPFSRTVKRVTDDFKLRLTRVLRNANASQRDQDERIDNKAYECTGAREE